ncbi:hypothetical protein DPMN_133465 [Dreissena polymorpha]|uniref:Uncharacterized protein n=1 Tax=Dreissena polymorpha TaxID=45954 RepID=A0A9D4FX19_DREPO|nr:hypothetical protein DPMN_133465 [Dreissena polymorpha]
MPPRSAVVLETATDVLENIRRLVSVALLVARKDYHQQEIKPQHVVLETVI